MKKVISTVLIISAVVLLASCEMSLSVPSGSPLRVLSIGIESSASSVASDDAVDFAKAMEGVASRAGADVQTTVLADTTRIQATKATSRSIADAIRTLADSSSNDGTTLVYISGQGYTRHDATTADGKGVIFGAKDARFSPDFDYSADFGIIGESGQIVITGADLMDQLSQIDGSVILITDCDHSGALVGSKSIEIDSTDFNASTSALTSNLFDSSAVDTSKVQILTSSRRYEENGEAKSLGSVEHSAFTAMMLEGLGYDQETQTVKGVIPVAEGNGITMNSLYGYIYDRSGESACTPKMSCAMIDTVLFTF